MKKISGRLANLTPEQREKLLKKLREQKGEEKVQGIELDQFRAEGDSYPLSFSQQRLWFLDKLEGQNASYNIPAALDMLGPLNPAALDSSLQTLVERHESLRCIFVLEDDLPRVKIREGINFSLEVIDLSSLEAGEKEKEKNRICAEEARFLLISMKFL